MAYVLPEIREDKQLVYEWFPTPAQCVIYRNWGTVRIHKLAEVLKTDIATILRMAEEMGLDTEVDVSDEWLSRGYITIIRNNWHLLDYEGICTLLDWTPDYLAFILQEDDFLSIKLGEMKPGTPDLAIRPLTDEQQRRTKEIKEITLAARAHVPANAVRPFDFFDENLIEHRQPVPEESQIFKYRIIYSYCALYGDVFAGEKQVDMSFPDAMLAQYQALGINGIWTQAVLSKIAPYPFDPDLSEGYKKRLEGIRYLTEKLAKYGIELYLYFNEPRAMPDQLFEQYPELMGHTQYPRFQGMHTLCMSTEPVRRYLYEAVAYVVRNVPKLGGIYTITASENLTHCHSHTKNDQCRCPRCREKSREELIALVNRTICEGALSENSKLHIFAHTWGWEKEKMVRSVFENLPQKMGICIVSEFDVHKNILGVETQVIDYSISVEGPGEHAKAVWKYAAMQGRDAYAKVQLNNTWELSTIPFIPVYDKIYRHLKKIAETGDVNGLILSWTLGGYPSPMLELVQEFRKGRELPTLTEIYERLFPDVDSKCLEKAFKAFSDAFDQLPFSVQVVYYAPLQSGPANLLYAKPTGLKATMVGNPYDDLTTWRGHFPEDVFYQAFDELCENWKRGLEYIDILQSEDNAKLRLVKECAEGCYLTYASVRNQIRYLKEDTSVEEKRIVLQEEIQIAEKMLELAAHNAAFGYEASNHYYYTAQNLLEKIVDCNYLLDTLEL